MKVLSLFFIDRVDNYAAEDGIIKALFDRNFEELSAKYKGWNGADAGQVQAAYFAQKKRRSGEIELLDTKTGKTEEDAQAFELIMRDKERLLSADEPVAFIFSHSALREGWDNPNVFQICTLNQTASEMKKRQEIGRGVRIAVNQDGERVHESEVNVLTVVANESYERYVATYQQEIEDEYGREGVPPPPPDARKRGKAVLRKAYILKPEFKELWERIKHKTRYRVEIDTDDLIRTVVKGLDDAEIKVPKITITKAGLDVSAEDIFEAVQISGARTMVELAGRYPLPNMIDMVMHQLENTSPPVRITRKTVAEILKRTKHKDKAVDNPREFVSVFSGIVKSCLADILVDGIKYEKISEWYEMTQFEAEIESWMDYLVPVKRGVYDHVEWESDVEKKFVEEIDKREDVEMFIKLPAWFVVDTPVGKHNPDWAIVMKDEDSKDGKALLYLVKETKSTRDRDKLRPDEKRKVECAEKHFEDALGVPYEVVTAASELPGRKKGAK